MRKNKICRLSAERHWSFFEKFNGLYKQLRSRKNFDVDHDDGFFMRVQKTLDESQKLYTSIAEVDGVPIAGHVSSMLGDTCVYLSLGRQASRR